MKLLSHFSLLFTKPPQIHAKPSLSAFNQRLLDRRLLIFEVFILLKLTFTVKTAKISKIATHFEYSYHCSTVLLIKRLIKINRIVY